jgi:hypothetical protein
VAVSNESTSEEEVEQVREVIGERVPMAGFYSYEWHHLMGALPVNCNQTMTLTPSE